LRLGSQVLTLGHSTRQGIGQGIQRHGRRESGGIAQRPYDSAKIGRSGERVGQNLDTRGFRDLVYGMASAFPEGVSHRLAWVSSSGWGTSRCFSGAFHMPYAFVVAPLFI
jgi:hypothetical protein